MNNERREEIILATLQLASQYGLRGISMSMIAEKVGIKKPSLYNHFKSKAEIVNEMYEFLRGKAMKKATKEIPANYFDNKTGCEILQAMVENYIALSTEGNMHMFYKVIYCERAISREASKIMVNETEKMINATMQVFSVLQAKNLLSFSNLEFSAITFALTIHGLMDYEADKSLSETGSVARNIKPINDFIVNFCEQHSIRSKT